MPITGWDTPAECEHSTRQRSIYLSDTSINEKDLDILCLDTPLSQEEIKARLVQNNPRFYLVNPRSSFATYKVLWYYIVETNSCLKVDILLPGVLNIPSIPVSSITRRNADGLPCAPFSLVLLLKLQAWAHHGEAMEWRFRVKQPTDERDIDELLVEAVKRKIAPSSDAFFPSSFLDVSRARVLKYNAQNPNSKSYWKAIGMWC